MITKQDCILLLGELRASGVDTEQMSIRAITSASVDGEVLKFINDHREISLTAFYRKIRKSYNEKHSKLYINIMSDLDETRVFDVTTTLSSLATQILLFSECVEDREMFLRHSRLSQIYQCLFEYSKTFNLINCIKLLGLIKCDIKALESISR